MPMKQPKTTVITPKGYRGYGGLAGDQAFRYVTLCSQSKLFVRAELRAPATPPISPVAAEQPLPFRTVWHSAIQDHFKDHRAAILL
jgi:hypothetical protein